jgi:hypothetical protein
VINSPVKLPKCYNSKVSEFFSPAAISPEEPVSDQPQPQTEPSNPDKPAWNWRVPKIKQKIMAVLVGLVAPFLVHDSARAEPLREFALYIPELNNPATQSFIQASQEVRQVRLETDGSLDDSPEVIVVGDSLAATTAFLNPEHNPDPTLSVINLSAKGARFGAFGTESNQPNQALLPTDALLAHLDQQADKPEFLLFFLGRNDCNLVNTSRALEYLDAYQQTGSLPTDTGFTAEWVTTMITLIDSLKARGILPIMTTSTPIVSETYCDLNSQHINLVFAKVAELSTIPLIVPASTEYVRGRTTHPFLYGQDTVTPQMVSYRDGIHLSTNMYGDLNQLLFGSLSAINVLTTPPQLDLVDAAPTQPDARVSISDSVKTKAIAAMSQHSTPVVTATRPNPPKLMNFDRKPQPPHSSPQPPAQKRQFEVKNAR